MKKQFLLLLFLGFNFFIKCSEFNFSDKSVTANTFDGGTAIGVLTIDSLRETEKSKAQRRKLAGIFQSKLKEAEKKVNLFEKNIAQAEAYIFKIQNLCLSDEDVNRIEIFLKHALDECDSENNDIQKQKKLEIYQRVKDKYDQEILAAQANPRSAISTARAAQAAKIPEIEAARADNFAQANAQEARHEYFKNKMKKFLKARKNEEIVLDERQVEEQRFLNLFESRKKELLEKNDSVDKYLKLVELYYEKYEKYGLSSQISMRSGIESHEENDMEYYLVKLESFSNQEKDKNKKDELIEKCSLYWDLLNQMREPGASKSIEPA